MNLEDEIICKASESINKDIREGKFKKKFPEFTEKIVADLIKFRYKCIIEATKDRKTIKFGNIGKLIIFTSRVEALEMKQE